MTKLGYNEDRSPSAAEPVVRLGYIDFLNSLPVYYGLESGAVKLPAGVELVKSVPAALNRKLLAGEIDVSAMSSVEYARHADELVLLPDLSINSAGFVHSVNLLCRNGVESLEGGTISMSAESATSHVLLRILLAKRFGIRANLVVGDADPEEIGAKSSTGSGYDGVLLIGDSAMKASLAYPNLGRIDLGDEWTRWTGTPMVFALWAARRDLAPDALAAVHRALLASKAWGRANRATIVEHARKNVFLSRAYMERYFRDLNYDLDRPKLAGLKRFYDEAAALGEIARVPSLSPIEVKA